jgi:hypothetical protein
MLSVHTHTGRLLLVLAAMVAAVCLTAGTAAALTEPPSAAPTASASPVAKQLPANAARGKQTRSKPRTHDGWRLASKTASPKRSLSDGGIGLVIDSTQYVFDRCSAWYVAGWGGWEYWCNWYRFNQYVPWGDYTEFYYWDASSRCARVYKTRTRGPLSLTYTETVLPQSQWVCVR